MLILASALIIADIAWAWGDSWESIRSAAGTVNSLEAQFTQEKHLPILARPLVSRGRLLFKAPDSLRWEYADPMRNVLLMDRGRTARYVQSDGQWVPDRTVDISAVGVVMAQISGWLGGRFQEEGMFAAALAEGPVIVLTPATESLARMIQRIELKLSSRAGLMESVTIYEGPDAFTRLTFSDAVLNPDLDDARFGRP